MEDVVAAGLVSLESNYFKKLFLPFFIVFPWKA
jgi:hypothetical protein